MIVKELVKQLLDLPMNAKVMVRAGDIAIGRNVEEVLTEVEQQSGEVVVLIAEDLCC